MSTAADATRALRLAVAASFENSPRAAILLEQAVELCKSAGCTANLPYASALVQLSELRRTGGDSTQALRIAVDANAVLVALDETDVAVQTELARCDNARGSALNRLGRGGESLLAHQASLRRNELYSGAR